MNIKRIVRTLVLVAILIPIAVELALRLIFSSLVTQAAVVPSVAASISPASVNATFDLTIFQHEHDAMFSQNYFADDGLYFTPDYHGKYINIQDNHRVTTDQPHNAPHTIYLFGSSAIWNIEVPDQYTIASDLQRQIGSGYRIENMGLMAADASKQLRVLKKISLRPGDIVVFYDGFIDAMMQPRTTTQNRAATGVCPWLVQHASWSNLVLVLCHLNTIPDQALIEQGYRDYRTAIIQAHDYTRTRGAIFYHFIQPTIYAFPSRAEEASMAFDQALYDRAWPMLLATPYTLDLSNCLNEVRQSSTFLFFDEIHVNQYGDVVIARAIAEVIAPTF